MALAETKPALESEKSGDQDPHTTDTFEDAPESAIIPEPNTSQSNKASEKQLEIDDSTNDASRATVEPASSTTNAEVQNDHTPVEKPASSTEPVPSVNTDAALDHSAAKSDNSSSMAGPKPSVVEKVEAIPDSDTHKTTSADDLHLKELDHKDNDASSVSSETLSKPSSRTDSLASRLPALPWSGLGTGRHHDSKNGTATGPKKTSTGLSSWLTRKGSSHVDQVSQSTPRDTFSLSRRSTMASINSLTSNPELTLKKLAMDSGNGDTNASSFGSGNSLRDRFKSLRQREEATSLTDDTNDGHDPTNNPPSTAGGALAGLIGRSASLGLGIASPSSVAEDKNTVEPKPSDSAMPVAPIVPTTNSLPQETEPESTQSQIRQPLNEVDWDLWQSVVYEGPSAVAKKSSEELARAIASGIPSAIRGVVWQVLAQSKNEDLESVYRELVLRGTEKDIELSINHTSHPNTQHNSVEKGFGSASINTPAHLEHSSSVSLASPLASPTHEKDSEHIAKAQAQVVIARQKQIKDERLTITKLERVIRKDLGTRTSYSKYAVASNLQDGLFGVCKAYALFDEGVGYAQGMNFLVMPLLFNMPEEEAFCLLVRLMNQYHLREMFIQDMPGLHLHLYQFERLLEDFEPALHCHLYRRAVRPQLYATQWFLTLFAYRFPLPLVLRIYDLILSEGLEGAILKFGIVLMQKNVDTLLGMTDMGALTTFLKERIFDVYIDQAPSSSSLLESGFFGSSGDKEVYRADILVQDACAVKITPQMLKLYTSEWQEQQATEKARETELDNLRATSTTLSQKVRVLEQRTERSDAEHVQMASELVRTKVENQELLDQVESLKGQTAELTAMVDKQTEEVENRLQAEMERIMERNAEVQNTNRGLEEQMAEMEKELVETKMRFAELNSDHEGLRQKWSDLRKALGA